MCAKRVTAVDLHGASSAPRIPLYLMAKVPIAGQVKTRMQPQLDSEQAVQLAQLMITQSVDTACNYWPGEVMLCAWPQPRHPLFTHLASKYRLTLTAQRGADLGARMLQALQQGIARADCAAVMGCDVPHCTGEILTTAHAILTRSENAVGAAEDGGFYLLGLQRADESLFAGINWSSGTELDALRKRTMRSGIHFSELPPLRDIDCYSDLEWLAEIDPAYQQFVH